MNRILALIKDTSEFISSAIVTILEKVDSDYNVIKNLHDIFYNDS